VTRAPTTLARLTTGAIAALLLTLPLASNAAAQVPAGTTAKPKSAKPAGTHSATHATAKKPKLTEAQVIELAKTARGLEELGAYSRAAESLRQLRANTAADADLDLELALDEARSGHADSAAALLWTPLMERALADSLPAARRHEYPWQREPLWLNGHFDGWNWYIARARAEVAATLGRWDRAHEAAIACVAARPLAGKEWHILAVCAGRDGQPGEARLAAHYATSLDPTLPEAAYLSGVHEWRASRRAQAQALFRAAVALDSTWQLPALALVRSRLPGTPADSLPTALLTGVRAVGLLTSPLGPKLEEFVQMDLPATILHRGEPHMPDSLMAHHAPVTLDLTVLVDERGRAVLHELPWFEQTELPAAAVAALVGSLTDWRFRPAMKDNAPHRVWATVEYNYSVHPPANSAAPSH
jgi:tetratricopeptide (TPR) repeat protein